MHTHSCLYLARTPDPLLHTLSIPLDHLFLEVRVASDLDAKDENYKLN